MANRSQTETRVVLFDLGGVLIELGGVEDFGVDFDPRTDAIKDSLSFGFGFSAVKATFLLPHLIGGE